MHANISVPIYGRTASLLIYNVSDAKTGYYAYQVVVYPPCDATCQMSDPFPCYFPPPAIPPPPPGTAAVRQYIPSSPGSGPGSIQNIIQVLPKFGETTPQYWLMESVVTTAGIQSGSLQLCDAQGTAAPPQTNFSPWYNVFPNGTTYLYSTLPTRETVYQTGVIDSAGNVQAWAWAVDPTLVPIMQQFPDPQYSSGPAFYTVSGSMWTVSAQLYFPSDMTVQTFVFNTSAPFDASSTTLSVEDDTGALTQTAMPFSVSSSNATLDSPSYTTPVQFIVFTVPYGSDTMTVYVNNATKPGYFTVTDSSGAYVLPTKEAVATDASPPGGSSNGSNSSTTLPPPPHSSALASTACLMAVVLCLIVSTVF